MKQEKGSLHFCTILIVVLCELFTNGDTHATFPRIRAYGRDYNVKQSESSTPKYSSASPLDQILEMPNGQCNFTRWPKENYVAGPLEIDKQIASPVFKRICPREKGIFADPTSCDKYIMCQDNCLVMYRCPSPQYFDNSTRSCRNVHGNNNNCTKSAGKDEDYTGESKVFNQSLTNFLERRGLSEGVDNDLEVSESKWASSRSHEELSSLNRGYWIGEDANRKTNTGESSKSWNNHEPGQVALAKHSEGQSRNETLSSLATFSQPTSTLLSRIDCSNEEGIFPHPTSCYFFVQCASGNQFIQRCGSGTVFNSELSICDWPRNVPECNGNENTDSRLKRSINNREEDIVIDSDGNRARHKILKSRVGGSRLGKMCTGWETNIRPHPEYCNKYEMCSNGRVVVETCGPGTLFDPLNSVCNFPDKVDCESRKADLGTYDCQKQHSYITSHWEFCNKFVECHKGVLAVKSCPFGLAFDVDTSSCDYSDKVRCMKPISLEHDTDVNIARRLVRSHNEQENFICETNYIAPHPTCNKFVECENKRVFVKSCGPGTVYNKYIGVCDWAYNTREVDEENCNAYKECQGGEWRTKHCREGLSFNPENRKCEISEIVQCKVQVQPPRPAES